MLVGNQCICPCLKDWKPLATQQYRLRNVIQIIGANVGKTDLEGRSCGTTVKVNQDISYYYTLHLTAMSAPFYTSEKLKSKCPKWKEINASLNFASKVFCGIGGFIFRLWCHDNKQDCNEVVLFWAVNLSGLVKISTHFNLGEMPKAPNTIIFLMPGGYYVNPSILNLVQTSRLTCITIDNHNVRQSYSISHINKLNAAQKLVLEMTNETAIIKQKIVNGHYLTADSRGSATIRRLLNKNKPKINRSDVARLKDSLDVARFRLKLLNDEKTRILSNLDKSRHRLESLVDENQIKESQTMENYRLLRREVEAYREWLVGHYQRREAQLHAKALLNFRIQQLISELHYIYPIVSDGDKFTICGVHLPDSENLALCDDLQVSVALGFVAHTTQMISIFLQVPLRYPVIHVGSRSCIMDLIVDQVPDNEREFPLYCKGKDKLQFNYAVYLLNKNIAALRWLCGLATHDLRSTLPNLSSLLSLRGAESSYESLPRSPTQSGVDMTSSSFTISSPAKGSLGVRIAQRHRLSESSAEFSSLSSLQKRSTASSFHYYDSRLYSSRPSIKTGSHSVNTNDPKMNNNFSYSLDKGLNEWEEIKRKAERQVKKTSLSSSARSSNLGSVSNLQTSLNPLDINKSSDSECPPVKFLQSWDSAKNYVLVSDEDSDQNISCIFVDKTVSCIEEDCVLVHSHSAPDEGRISVGVDVGNSSYYSCSPEKEHSNEMNVTLMGVEARNDTIENVASDIYVEEGGIATNEVAYEVTTEDALLDNVTDRTEALANQTISFNMFRSRFRSTLGGTN